MEKPLNVLDNLFTQLEKLVDTSLELYQLKFTSKLVEHVSNTIFKAIGLLVFSTCLLFASVALALFVGKVMESMAIGFLMVATFYGLVGIVLTFIMGKYLKLIIVNYCINIFFNNKNL